MVPSVWRTAISFCKQLILIELVKFRLGAAFVSSAMLFRLENRRLIFELFVVCWTRSFRDKNTPTKYFDDRFEAECILADPNKLFSCNLNDVLLFGISFD